jgi:hypothetical protein
MAYLLEDSERTPRVNRQIALAGSNRLGEATTYRTRFAFCGSSTPGVSNRMPGDMLFDIDVLDQRDEDWRDRGQRVGGGARH